MGRGIFQAAGGVNPPAHRVARLKTADVRDIPKCKGICPGQLSPAASILLSSLAMSSLFRDATEEAEMPKRPVSQSFVPAMTRPRAPSWRARDAKMSPMEFIGLVAGWSTALVAVFGLSVFIRFIG
jgi:hypothetical protein